MCEIKYVRLPNINVLWDRYQMKSNNWLALKWYDLHHAKLEWDYEQYCSPESVKIWHQLMVVTEILKMRKGWNDELGEPRDDIPF